MTLSSLERFLVIVMSSAAFGSLVALFLAEVGYFKIWLLDLLLACLVVLFLALRKEGSGLRKSVPLSRWEKIIVMFLILLAVFLFFRPAEYVVGEGDPEYYYNIGHQLAESGSMNVCDESVTKMNDFEISTFFNRGIVQFLPFHLRDRTKGRIQPLLYHLLPVWIALFVKMFGMRAGLFVNPLFGLLLILCAYALSRRFSQVLPSFLCAAALSFFFLQIWFSRMPVSETFASPFVVMGMIMFKEFRDLPSGGSAFLCPLFFTVASLARPEGAVFIFLILVVCAFDFFTLDFTGSYRLLTNGLLLGSILLIAYIRFCALEYVTANVGKVLKFFGERATVGGALRISAILITLFLILFNLRFLNRALSRFTRGLKNKVGTFLDGVKEFVNVGVPVIILFSAFYLYFSQRAKSVDQAAERIFFNTASFMGGMVVFLFFFALALFIYESKGGAFAFVTGFATLLLLFASQEPSLALGQYPWDSRRMMLFVIPMLFVSASYLMNRGLNSKKIEFKTWSLLVALLLIIFFLASSVPILIHVENRGGIEGVSALARRFKGNMVMFTGYYNGEVIGIPLRYTFGVDARRVFKMSDPWRFAEIIARVTSSGQKVYLEESGISAREIPYNGRVKKLIEFRPAFSEEISLKRLKPASRGIPREMMTQKINLRFYELEPTEDFLRRIRK